jgi:hypothetical protein
MYNGFWDEIIMRIYIPIRPSRRNDSKVDSEDDVEDDIDDW